MTTSFTSLLAPLVSGPPSSLSLLSKTENSLQIRWQHPQITNGPVLEYHVSAAPVSSYSVTSVSLPLEWHFQNSTTSTELLGLQAGTKYNISIKAKTTDGYGTPLYESLTTEIGGKYLYFHCKMYRLFF